MPYNPGSAYPKKTTYVPPHPQGWHQPPVNPVHWGPQSVNVHGSTRSTLGAYDAIAARAMRLPGTARDVATSLERPGLLDRVQSRQNQERGLMMQQARKRSQGKQERVPEPETQLRAQVNKNVEAMMYHKQAEDAVANLVGGVLSNDVPGVNTPLSVPWKFGGGRKQ